MYKPLNYSIIITTYNRKYTLLKNIELLAAQQYPKNCFELIIVNDGCTDGTDEALQKIKAQLPFSFKYIVMPKEEKKTFRFSQAHNMAISQAEKEYLFFLDDDALPMLTMLGEHTRFHYLALEKFKVDAAVIGATIEGADYKKLAEYKLEDIAKADSFYRFCSKYGADLPENYFITNNASVKKKYVTAVNGFTETKEYWAGIDNDLGVRMKAKYPDLRYLYAYTSITAHKTIHPDDFKTARATSSYRMPDEVKAIIKEKTEKYKKYLGIENAYER